MQKYNMEQFLKRYMDIEKVKLFDILKLFPEIEDGVWLAGGAVRRTISDTELNSDYDFFFRSEESYVRFREKLLEIDGYKTKSTDTSETYLLKKEDDKFIIQLIKVRYYKTVEDLLNSFDFTISQFAYDGTNLYCGDYSLWDLSRKRLALNKLTYGVSTVRRLLKYTNQGFTACSGVLQNILESVVSDPKTINSDVVSVD